MDQNNRRLPYGIGNFSMHRLPSLLDGFKQQNTRRIPRPLFGRDAFLFKRPSSTDCGPRSGISDQADFADNNQADQSSRFDQQNFDRPPFDQQRPNFDRPHFDQSSVRQSNFDQPNFTTFDSVDYSGPLLPDPVRQGSQFQNFNNSFVAQPYSIATNDPYFQPRPIDLPANGPRSRRTILPNPEEESIPESRTKSKSVSEPPSKSASSTVVEPKSAAGPSKRSRSPGPVIIDYEHNSANDTETGGPTPAKMQKHFSSHLNSIQWSGDDLTLSDSNLNLDRSSTLARESEDEKLYYRHGSEYYYRLAVDSMNQYDKSYEQSIWDYDPKFTWDYLPGTSRGATEVKSFVFGQNYYGDETKWKKQQWLTDRVYSHEIQTRKEIFEKGGELYDDKSDKPISVRPMDIQDPIQELFTVFDQKIGFPEKGITEDYCEICDIAFQSVTDSVKHYESVEHEKKVRQHFVDGLIQLSAIRRSGIVPPAIENGIIKHGFKKYKIRPSGWFCDLCDVAISSSAMAELHFNGAAHQKRRSMVRNRLVR